MLTVGVLGANGFVGSRLQEVFHLNREHRVVPIVHSVSGLSRVARFGEEWRIADAADPLELERAFQGCDVVVHAIAGSLESIVKSPAATLRAARAAGVKRVVYLSTASVHGQDPEPGTDEDSPLHTRHLVDYNNAKVIAERGFLGGREASGVEVVVLRPGIVFGPRDVWISGIARSIAEGKAYLVDEGRGYCNSIYVDNLVHAIRCALHADSNGQVFLVGDREALTWRELYLRVAAMVGHAEPIPSVTAPLFYRRQRSAIESIKAIPGVQSCLDHLPAPPKLWARKQFEAASRIRTAIGSAYRTPSPNPWKARVLPATSVSAETAMLHRCRHKFAYDKARTMLAYEPPVPLADALKRCEGWLDFIGYTIRPDTFRVPLNPG